MDWAEKELGGGMHAFSNEPHLALTHLELCVALWLTHQVGTVCC